MGQPKSQTGVAMRIWGSYLLALAIAGTLFVASMSLSVPVPPREQYQCQQEAKTYGEGKPANCPTSETIWQKTLKDPVAYYTAWLTAFTLVLAAVGIVQSLLTNQQIKLARNEFLASHRPKIRVRSVGYDEKLTDAEYLVLKFTCVNIGDSPCEIIEVRYGLHAAIKPGEPTQKEKLKNIPLHAPVTLGPGEPTAFSTHLMKGDEITNLTFEFDFFGYVAYVDQLGIRRFMGFWRRHDVTEDNWTAPEHPDFNYEY